MGIEYHRIRIATPRHNEKVERQHRTDVFRFYRNMKMYSLKMAMKQVAILTISISLAVLLSQYIENWLILSVIFLLMMKLLLRIFNMKIPAVYAFPFLIFVFPAEKVSGLPLASLTVSVVCFGMVYLFHTYLKPKIMK